MAYSDPPPVYSDVLVELDDTEVRSEANNIHCDVRGWRVLDEGADGRT